MTYTGKAQGHSSSVKETYDFIVCGAGAAGSVVAGRLAENPNVSVLLIEAGGSDDTDMVLDTDRWPMNLGGELDWSFLTEPNPRLNGRALLYSMGKVLGGGSSINVGTWSKGHKADWDFYAGESGDPAWRHDAILDVYRKKVESWQGTADPQFYGVEGPMYVQPLPDPDSFSLALLEGAVSSGIAQFQNSGGQMMTAPAGCSVADNIIHGKRAAIRVSFLRSSTS